MTPLPQELPRTAIACRSWTATPRCVSIKFRKNWRTREQILAAWTDFKPLAGKDLPFAPKQPVAVRRAA